MNLLMMILLIVNFGKVDDHVYRSAQIKPAEVQEIKNLGVEVVINLRKNPEKWEKEAVEAAGMRYYNFPMSTTKRPDIKQVNQIIALIQQEKGKILVHCAGGRHRTGVIIAVWRILQHGWNFDQVYAEMKLYHYYSGLTHGKLKDFVRDFANAANP